MTDKQSDIIRKSVKQIENIICKQGMNQQTKKQIEKILQSIEVPVRLDDKYKLIRPFKNLTLDEWLTLDDDAIDFRLNGGMES